MWKRVVPAVLLSWFLFRTIGALADHSYLGFFMVAGANSATRLMLLDLVLALGLATVWMIRDARRRQGSWGPFVAITALFGVAGPLLYLVTRGWGRGRERLAALAVLAALAFAAGSLWNWADLRPPALQDGSADATREGRELLERLAARHGLEAWRRHATMEVVATDLWRQGGWWPAPRQRFRSQSLLGTFTSRVELLDGPRAGEIRGLQSWTAYRREPGSADVAIVEPAPEITFYLPTLQYFSELPFRLLEADIVLHGGGADHRGRAYELLFATWGAPEPGPEHDQYVLWIGRDSGLVEMVRYTVRDLAPMASGLARRMMRAVGAGTIHFDDYREIDGVMVPFAQTVVLQEPALTSHPIGESFLHRLEIEMADFDSVSRQALLPLPGLPAPEDRKPAHSPDRDPTIVPRI